MALVVCLAPALAQIPKWEYRERRRAAQKALPDGVLVLFGRTERDIDELRTGFHQEPNFEYLTGWNEPGAILLLSPAAELLFLPQRDPKEEKYTGAKASAEDANIRAVTGFVEVLPAGKFEMRLLKALEAYARLYTLTGRAEAAKLRSLVPFREVADAAGALAELREKKSPREIALIQKSTDVSVEAHRAVWKRIAPGLYEYQIAATFTYTILDNGCARNAYAPIVGSGPNATILHYSKNSRRIEPGDLVLMDAGAECADYATDITRTIPASGKFTPRQRELYEIVLGAQKTVLAAIKPGVTMGATPTAPNSLYRVAYNYINSHGKDRAGKPLGQYLTHGVSHHVGLDVHDAPPASYSQPLEPGMVITAEPGIYIPEEAIGIRIEDTILVTQDGAKVLSGALPKEPGEIEKILAAR